MMIVLLVIVIALIYFNSGGKTSQFFNQNNKVTKKSNMTNLLQITIVSTLISAPLAAVSFSGKGICFEEI